MTWLVIIRFIWIYTDSKGFWKNPFLVVLVNNHEPNDSVDCDEMAPLGHLIWRHTVYKRFLVERVKMH